MRATYLSRSLVSVAVAFLVVVLTLAVTIAQAQSNPTQPADQSVCFAADLTVTCVDRAATSASSSITDQVRSLVEALLSGPTAAEQAAGVQSALPAGTQLHDVSVADDEVTVELVMPDADLKTLDATQVEDIHQQFAVTFTPFNFRSIAIKARAADGSYQFISSFLPKIEIPRKEPSPPTPRPTTKSAPSGEGRGGLSGKTVFVSAGHGWYWNTTFNTYRTQRPVYPLSPYPAGEGLIEDFNNAEAVNQYLLQYLENAGADAWTVRERDMNTTMIIVDDASADFSTQGSWPAANGGYAGGYHFASSAIASATVTATWSFTLPANGTYAVYVRFPNTTTLRSGDVHYFVDHAGGTTPLTITQARDGNNWRFIGNYPFYGGQAARIHLTNQSATSSSIVLADAVRIGGGVGDTSVAGAPPSNKPRWEEEARQYAKWVGMPDVDNLNDVIVRPIYAEWEKEAGEDSVYISWHTNGYNGYNTTARGTESYIHSFQPTPNSDVLQNFVHTELLHDIRTAWDATWPDRGKKTMDLGELRLLDSMPGVLIENGYHDNPTDADAMKDPRFAELSARAIYHGLVKYWHSQDPNVPSIFLPEPPAQLSVHNSGIGQVTLTWQPGPTDGDGVLGDAAASYRVYTSTDGFGWAEPIAVTQTGLVLNGLQPDQLIFVKVTGVNAGGESLPTPVMAARVASSGHASIVIVYGFDRIDRYGDIQQNDSPEGLNRRMFVDRINRFDYIIQHADAITRAFDSAQHAAVSAGSIALGNYSVVDWLAGEEQPPFPALTTSDQTALTNFIDGGGALFISGAELGFALHDTPFYAGTLHASYVADDANTYGVSVSAGGIFDGLGTFNFDDGTHGTYNVDYADVLGPGSGATSALVYNTGGSAAVQYANGCTRLVYSGVPFEAFYPAGTRQAVMARILDFLDECAPLDVDTTITSPPDNVLTQTVPAFTGVASDNAAAVQVSIRRVSDTTFYNGTSFISSTEVWLDANGTRPWSYTLPALSDSAYALRARAIASGPITDPVPAAVTFTLDTIAPDVPTIITPTGGITIAAIAPTFEWTGGGDPARFDLEIDGATHTSNGPALSATFAVTAGVHAWRVRAIDAALNQSAWSDYASFNTKVQKVYLPLLSRDFVPEPPVVSCREVITNGTFESGDLGGWAALAQNPPPAIVTDTVHTGSYAARIGKVAVSDTLTGFSSLQQTIDVPANALTATVAFARYRYSNDLNNLQYVAVLSGTTTLDYLVYEHVDDPSWQVEQFDLLPYVGQSITLRFSVWNKTAEGVTGQILDDISAQICTP